MTVLKPIKDKDLMDRLKKGDELALNYIYNVYSEQLFISAYNMLKNKELCEDIIQDVFISIWNKREKIQIKTTLKAYLYASVLYKVYDQYRKKNSLIRVELIENFNSQVEYTNPETKIIHNELVERINSIVDDLPEKCREVFKMSREEHLSHKEIALKLNISTKTIEAHITIALKKIRTSLGNSYSIEIISTLYFLINS